MPRLKEVARGSVQMLCVGRYSASKPQNLEEKAGVRAETPATAAAPARPPASPQLGQSGASWSCLAAMASRQPCPTTWQPSWPQGAPGPISPHGPCPAKPPSLVLIVQEVFCPQVLVDPAGSEDGCGEVVLADQAQGLQRRVVSSTGRARRSPCHLSCPHFPRSHRPHGGAGQCHGDVLQHLLLQGLQHWDPQLPLRAWLATQQLRVPPFLTAAFLG